MTGRPTLTVDAIGVRCPQPVIDLARRIGEVAVGDVVELLADDPAAASDVPAWCRMRGHDYLGAGPAPGHDPAPGGDGRSGRGATAYRVRRTH